MIVFIIILIIVAVPFIAALFIKKDYAIERTITINRPKQTVFDFVKYIKNQDFYNKWTMMDPNSKRDYKGTDGTAGFVATWESQNKRVGSGEQEITGIDEGKRLDLALHFIKPFEGRAKAYMITDPVTDNQTSVRWGLKSRMKYPSNLMLVVFKMEKSLGDDLAEGLVNLKNVLEGEKRL